MYSRQLCREVNVERERCGKKPVDDDHGDDDPTPPTDGGITEKMISTTDLDSSMLVKGERERQFAYEAHTVCDSRGIALEAEVIAGNIHDSVAWDKLYDDGTHKHEVQFVTMDAGYKTLWNAKKTLDDGKVPILPYTRYSGNQNRYKPWEYTYDPANDTYACPRGAILRHATTYCEGKTLKDCVNCRCKGQCRANEKGQKIHIAHLAGVSGFTDTEDRTCEENLCTAQKTIERVFADVKEKRAMRYAHHRGLTAVTRWVRLKYVAMNLKKRI